jgi:hypothetical protein
MTEQSLLLALILLAPIRELSPPRCIFKHVYIHLFRCYEQPRRVQKVTAVFDFFRHAPSPTFTCAPSRRYQMWALGPSGTLTISHCKNPRVEFPQPRRNTPKINFFHHRNQITNPHVHTTSVNS